MASETVIMLIRSIEAYVEKDMNKAQEVIRHDDIVDDLFDKNKADIIELIRHDPEKRRAGGGYADGCKIF